MAHEGNVYCAKVDPPSPSMSPELPSVGSFPGVAVAANETYSAGGNLVPSTVATMTVTTTEEVDNGGKCTSRLAQLYNSPKFSDITLIVGVNQYYGHRLLLANASDVFE